MSSSLALLGKLGSEKKNHGGRLESSFGHVLSIKYVLKTGSENFQRHGYVLESLVQYFCQQDVSKLNLRLLVFVSCL